MLEAPPSLLPRRATLPALRAALATGTSHPPTAAAALGALEQWHRDTAHVHLQGLGPTGGRGDDDDSDGLDALAPHLPELLPLLGPFLALPSASDGGGGDRSSDASRGRAGRLVKKGGRLRGGAGSGDDAGGTGGAEVEALQRRAVAFLGRLGGGNRCAPAGGS